MMRSRSSVVVIVWLVALCCDVTGFSIKRHSASKSDLSDAFRVLDRQRRRIRDDEYLAASRMPDPRAPISPSELADWGDEMPSREEQAWIQDAFGITPYEDQGYGAEEFVDDSESKQSPGPKTVEPSKEELQSIFGESGESNAKDSQASKDSTAGEDVPTVDESENDEESDDLTEAEYKALMSAVEKLQKRALVKKDTKSISRLTTPDPQPVSKEEMRAVFEEDDNNNDDGDGDGDDGNDDNAPEPADNSVGSQTVVAMETAGEDAEPADGDEIENSFDENEDLKQKYKDTLSSIKNYWRLNDYFNTEEKRRKRFTKRAPSAQPPDSVPLEETYMQEIQTLRNEIQQLKLLAQLEDMENDALTQTLNEATLSQMEGTVSVKEFGSLEQAIKLEEALQDLKNGKVNPLIVEIIAANAVGDLKKRGEPVWRKKEKRMDETGLEESYPMFSSDKRSSKRALIEGGYTVVPGEKRSAKRTREEDVDRWYDRPARENRDNERERYLETQNAIENMVSRLAESEMSDDDNNMVQDTDGDDDEDDDMLVQMPSYMGNSDNGVIPYSNPPESKPGQCPSAPLVTDCKFADLQGLPIDDEARELCNRHELCYECGATSGVKQGECDNLYRGDAAVLCDKDANCVIEAELFLQEMKMKHRYSMFYKGVCDNPCTTDYIGV